MTISFSITFASFYCPFAINHQGCIPSIPFFSNKRHCKPFSILFFLQTEKTETNVLKEQESGNFSIEPTKTVPKLDTSEWPLLLKNYDSLQTRTGHYTPVASGASPLKRKLEEYLKYFQDHPFFDSLPNSLLKKQERDNTFFLCTDTTILNRFFIIVTPDYTNIFPCYICLLIYFCKHFV